MTNQLAAPRRSAYHRDVAAAVRWTTFVVAAFGLCLLGCPTRVTGTEADAEAEADDDSGDTGAEQPGATDTGAAPSHCPPLDLTWSIAIDEPYEANELAVDHDGSVWVVTSTFSAAPFVRVLRFDADGQLVDTVDRQWWAHSAQEARTRVALANDASYLLGYGSDPDTAIVQRVEGEMVAWSWSRADAPGHNEGMALAVLADERVATVGWQAWSARPWLRVFDPGGAVAAEVIGEDPLDTALSLRPTAIVATLDESVVLGGRAPDVDGIWVAEVGFDGSIVWQTALDDDVAEGVDLARLPDGSLRALTYAFEHGEVHALTPNGAVEWRFSIEGGFAIAPLDADAVVLSTRGDQGQVLLSRLEMWPDERHVLDVGLADPSTLERANDVASNGCRVAINDRRRVAVFD